MKTGGTIVTLLALTAMFAMGTACSGPSNVSSEQIATNDSKLLAITDAAKFQVAYLGGYSWSGGSAIGTLGLFGEYNADVIGTSPYEFIRQGTSPSMVELAGNSGYMTAYQGNTSGNYLTLYGRINAVEYLRNTGYGMMAGTSPSIAAQSGGSYEVAFQANTGILWIYSSLSGTAVPTGYGMNPGTSPSIVALPNGGYEVAFQGAGNGKLWLYTNAAYPTTVQMAPGTSPSMVVWPNGNWEVAVQNSNNDLQLYGSLVSGDLGYGIMSGTSPSITMQGGSYVVAFQANTGGLWVYGPAGGWPTGNNMASGASPSIAALPSGDWMVAYQGSNGDLSMYGTLGSADTYYKMGPGTSPSIIVPPPTPSTPTGFSYTTGSSNCTATVNLSWNRVNGAMIYNMIEAAPGPNYYSRTFMTTTNTSWSNLLFSSNYSYSVNACNANGSCSSSTSINVTTGQTPSGCVKPGVINVYFELETPVGTACGSATTVIGSSSQSVPGTFYGASENSKPTDAGFGWCYYNTTFAVAPGSYTVYAQGGAYSAPVTVSSGGVYTVRLN